MSTTTTTVASEMQVEGLGVTDNAPQRKSSIRTTVMRAKRRFSESVPSVSFSLPSIEKALPKFFQPEPELPKNSIAPTTHKENTALHALLDSLPTLPTLANVHLPSLSFPTPSMLCFPSEGAYSSDDEDLVEVANAEPELKNDPIKQLRGNTVVLGGYRGSTLRDAKSGKRLWIPFKVGFNWRKPDLGIGLSDEDELRSTETVVPSHMLMSIGRFIDLGKKLKDKLKALEAAPTQEGDPQFKFHNWGYDWRRRLELSSAELLAYLEQLKAESAARGEGKDGQGEGSTVVAHSMGGLVVLHALARAKDPTVFKGILFAGTPFNGCVNVLGPLKKGDGVMFNREICSPEVVFSMRSSFYFLPENGQCFETPDGESVPVDFFSVKSWSDWHFSPISGSILAPESATKEKTREELREEATKAQIQGLQAAVPEGQELRDALTVPKDDLDDAASGSGSDDGEVSPPLPASSPEKVPSAPGPQTDRIRNASDVAIADYLDRTLSRVKKFNSELVDLYDESKADQYPPMAIITSHRTPTVRGVMTPDMNSVKSVFYQHLLYGPGDGIVLYDSAKTLPGGPDKWNKHLRGVVESNFGHVSLLADLDSVRKGLSLIQA